MKVNVRYYIAFVEAGLNHRSLRSGAGESTCIQRAYYEYCIAGIDLRVASVQCDLRSNYLRVCVVSIECAFTESWSYYVCHDKGHDSQIDCCNAKLDSNIVSTTTYAPKAPRYDIAFCYCIYTSKYSKPKEHENQPNWILTFKLLSHSA